VVGIETSIGTDRLLRDQYLLVQRGKTKYHLVKVE